jgi:hypothetical protein
MYINTLKKHQAKKEREYLKRQEMKNNISNQVRCPSCNILFLRDEFIQHSSNCNNIMNYDLLNSINMFKHTDNDYNDYLKGKTVVLVAPSKSILKTIQGDHIDSYDIIVRLNKSLPMPKYLEPYIGSRTDILYNNLNLTDFPGENVLNMYMLKKTIKYISCPYPPITPFAKDIDYFKKLNNKYNIPFHHINLKYYETIVNNIRTRTNTGIGAILDLLNYDIKELYITGITFFKDGHYNEYRNIPLQRVQAFANNGIIHSQEPQIELLRRLVLNDKRIRIDKTLNTILFNIYDNVIKNLRTFSFKHCFVGPKQELLKKTFLDVIKNKSMINIYIKFNTYEIKDNDEQFKTIIAKIINNNEIKLNILDSNIECSLRLMEPYRYNENAEYIYYLNGIYTQYLVKQLKRINIINISVGLFTIIYFATLYPNHNIYSDKFNSINVNEQYFYKYLLRLNILQLSI